MPPPPRPFSMLRRLPTQGPRQRGDSSVRMSSPWPPPSYVTRAVDGSALQFVGGQTVEGLRPSPWQFCGNVHDDGRLRVRRRRAPGAHRRWNRAVLPGPRIATDLAPRRSLRGTAPNDLVREDVARTSPGRGLLATTCGASVVARAPPGPHWALPTAMSAARTHPMFDPRRTDDELRNWADWLIVAVATCLGAASVAAGIWLSAVAMVLVGGGAAGRLYRRRTRATPKP